jgi:thiamine biosynthesis lipoprotein
MLRTTDPAAVAIARAAAEEDLAVIDRACSRLRSDSELSRVNARAGRWTTVSPLLLEAPDVAVRQAKLTDGDIDPTLGLTLQLADYDRDWRSREHSRAQLDHATATTLRARSGWQTLVLDRSSRSLRMPAGVGLDLGASATAWAADRASAAAHRASGCGALVSLGGDIATAGPPPDDGWRIRVADNHSGDTDDCSTPRQTVAILAGGLATSSPTAISRTSGPRTLRRINHLPSAAVGAGAWRSVSVVAANCTDAKIAAAAAIVKPQTGAVWLARRGLSARLLDWQGNVTAVGDWPAETADTRAPWEALTGWVALAG